MVWQMELFSRDISACREIAVLPVREILERGGIAVLAFAWISTRREFSVTALAFAEISTRREFSAYDVPFR